ncbi:MAG: hypothetical protein ACOCW6_10580 [Spirochaetota bacterium]
MPWKLFFVILLLGLVVTFVGLNAQNSTDISFGFTTLSDIPIYISLFSAFFIGVLITLPFTFRRRSKSNKEPKEPKQKRGRKKKQEAPPILPGGDKQ